MMGNLGWGEILTIVVVLLLLFGARRIPEAARGIGRGLREFKAGLSGDVPPESQSSAAPCCPACADKPEGPTRKTGGA